MAGRGDGRASVGAASGQQSASRAPTECTGASAAGTPHLEGIQGHVGLLGRGNELVEQQIVVALERGGRLQQGEGEHTLVAWHVQRLLAVSTSPRPRPRLTMTWGRLEGRRTQRVDIVCGLRASAGRGAGLRAGEGALEPRQRGNGRGERWRGRDAAVYQTSTRGRKACYERGGRGPVSESERWGGSNCGGDLPPTPGDLWGFARGGSLSTAKPTDQHCHGI